MRLPKDAHSGERCPSGKGIPMVKRQRLQLLEWCQDVIEDRDDVRAIRTAHLIWDFEATLSVVEAERDEAIKLLEGLRRGA